MNDDSWTREWETRPLVGRAVYSLPVCSLKTPDSTEPVRFRQNRVAIGSDADNDVVLRDDTVSRFHAEIRRSRDSYLIRDLDSTNGTYVDSVRVLEAHLSPGTVIEIGEVTVEFSPSSEVVQVSPVERSSMGRLVGISQAMKQLYHLIEQVAPTDATVLLQGETGTGKEVAARTIHQYSRRADRPFVVVDCTSIPANLMESELFGHEKGSFSGALTGRKGLFEMADGGTVFLDEVGELPPDLQPKLLRVLETGELRRVGSGRTLQLDVRIVAATNRNLQEEVAEKRFREDLFYRLNVVPVRIPPLRERREDIDVLAEHILAVSGFNDDGKGGRRLKRLDAVAMNRLRRHDFPGNVRELVNLLEREVSLAGGAGSLIEDSLLGGVGSSEPVTEAGRPGRAEEPFPRFKEAKEQVVRKFEEGYLQWLLEIAGNNLSRASRLSGIDRKYLRELLKKHGLYYSG